MPSWRAWRGTRAAAPLLRRSDAEAGDRDIRDLAGLRAALGSARSEDDRRLWREPERQPRGGAEDAGAVRALWGPCDLGDRGVSFLRGPRGGRGGRSRGPAAVPATGARSLSGSRAARRGREKRP